MNRTDKRLVAFQLPVSVYKDLSMIAEKNFRSISAEIRAIISAYIDSNKSNIGEETANDELSGKDC